MKKPLALIILDGWGISEEERGNALKAANPVNFNKLQATYPTTTLGASGLNVGLPDGQMGNSEVGHLNIGAGRIVYQELTRITKSIKDGDFFENASLVKAMEAAKSKGTNLHVMGLLSDGGVHSHINHLKAVIKMAKEFGLENVYVHGFMDGRDTAPKSGLGYIQELENYMTEINFGKIATVSGRYYAMDRDQRWERTELAYDAIVKGEGEKSTTASECMEASYADGKTDEFVLPTVIDGAPKLGADDAVIFYNFRPDRARQLTRALVDLEFSGFERKHFLLTYVCMTMYDVTIENVEVAFKPQRLTNTLGEFLAANGKNQLRIAETEKYAHVTFFFNGGVEEPNKGEERALISSPKVATYDLQPEMSAGEVTEKVVAEIDRDLHDVIILNFANPDMVGHTGIIDAAVKAVKTVDADLQIVVDKILEKGGSFIITADHGNVEQMLDADGGPMTAHTTNPVPCIIGGQGDITLREDGKLSDLAPTMLAMLGLDQPAEMTGRSLIK